MATHIDPFAPGDSPQHPANWKPDQEEHVTPEETQRMWELMDRHILPTEIGRSVIITLEELERRQALVDAYNAGLTGPTDLDAPIAVYIEDEGTTYRWEEAVGWTPLPPAAQPSASEPAATIPPPPADDPMAAAIAALDATKGK